MATILNQEYVESSVYLGGDDGYSEAQFYVDNSSNTTEDETLMAEMAKQAGAYAKRVSKKKFYDWHTKNESFLELYNDLYPYNSQI